MSTTFWRGDAAATAEVFTIVLTAYDTATTYKVTRNGKTISTVGTGGTTATTATALKALLAASTIPEFLEITWTVNSSTITGTAVTAGVPSASLFTSSVSGGTGTIDPVTVTTTNSGPNCYNVAANWSGGAVPTTEDVIIANSSVDILYGLSQSGNTLTSLTIDSSFTGKIGLPEYTGTYYQDRTLDLTQEMTTVNIGRGVGAGSQLLRLNVGSVACTCNVFNTSTSSETGRYALLFRGTSASNALNVFKGNVGVAVRPGETANLSGGFRIGYVSNPDGDATVFTSSGVTLTTFTQSGGNVTTNSNCTTITKTGGTLNHISGTMTALNQYAGTTYYQSTGTLSGGTNGGKVDFSRDLRSRTVTTMTLLKGAEYYDPDDTTGNSPFVLAAGVLLSDVKITRGRGKTFTPS